MATTPPSLVDDGQQTKTKTARKPPKPRTAANNRCYRQRNQRGNTLLRKAESFHRDTGDDVLLVLKKPGGKMMRVFCTRPSVANEFLEMLVKQTNNNNNPSPPPSGGGGGVRISFFSTPLQDDADEDAADEDEVTPIDSKHT